MLNKYHRPANQIGKLTFVYFKNNAALDTILSILSHFCRPVHQNVIAGGPAGPHKSIKNKAINARVNKVTFFIIFIFKNAFFPNCIICYCIFIVSFQKAFQI